jgi:hypothetical protein
MERPEKDLFFLNFVFGMNDLCGLCVLCGEGFLYVPL